MFYAWFFDLGGNTKYEICTRGLLIFVVFFVYLQHFLLRRSGWIDGGDFFVVYRFFGLEKVNFGLLFFVF
ncbi:hypothetical protein EI94DRAFT_1746606 [Lactarius quietus]|nr:hypothetical protein EI94DRAFT_1746606 [Lactarius quietus]